MAEAHSNDLDASDNAVRRIVPVVSHREQQQFEQNMQKIASILDACDSRDLKLLVELASSDGGLVDDQTRRRACTVSPVKRFPHSLMFDQGRYCLLASRVRGSGSRAGRLWSDTGTRNRWNSM